MHASPVPEPAGVDPQEFRRVVGRFATGVTVVSTVVDATDHAMTVSSFTSVSLDPVLVLFCVEKTARFHRAVLASGLWAVSVLAADAVDASAWFASRGRPIAGQLAGFRHRRGAHTGAAVLADAVAALECRTRAVHDGGDHTIVLADVLDVTVPCPDAQPLVYYDGGYRSLSGS